VAALLANQQDPTKGMTTQQLQDKYANYPGGAGGAIAARVLSEAQAQGYTAAGSDLGNKGASELNAAAHSGSLYNMAGAAVGNVVAPFIGAKLGSNSGRSLAPGASDFTSPSLTVRVRAPNGSTGSIPAANLKAALSQGYTQI
jgi:hypothetical protein